MAEEEAEILVAATSAVFADADGQTHRIVKGKTTARRGHKILKGREHMFKPLAITFDVPVVAKQSPSKVSKPKEPGS